MAKWAIDRAKARELAHALSSFSTAMTYVGMAVTYTRHEAESGTRARYWDCGPCICDVCSEVRYELQGDLS